MRTPISLGCLSAAIAIALAGSAFAADSVRMDAIEVTSSKIAQQVSSASSRVTVISGEELRERGATDLRSALARVAGVEISQGGDGGPASSVPAFWGLREFDAFLLVVDGVPWGGAFTPALASLDLANVERIEVLRGAAPVSYGATAFVGVIHVIHHAAGEGPGELSFGFGSRGSYRGALALPLAPMGEVKQSLLLDAEKIDWSADRAGYDRAHALYRLAMPLAAGEFGLDLDLSFLRQDPASPSPRAGAVLSPLVPIDSNQHPADARIDEDRVHLVARYSQDTGLGAFSALAAVSHSNQDLVRGFLGEDFTAATGNNAAGFKQDRSVDDFYLDLHWDRELSERSRLIFGADWLAGQGDQRSDNFDYRVALSGFNPPSSGSRPVEEITEIDAERNFLGLYADWQFQAYEDWRIDAGIRLNHTHENRDTSERDPGAAEVEGEGDTRTVNRLSGALGTSYRLWAQADDSLTAYANYKSTFKPAVVDFGPEAEPEILEPEYATSGEMGLRGTLADRRLQWDLSAFYMDFRNIVVPQVINGRPGLANAGTLHLKGVELEADLAVSEQLKLLGRFAWHDTSFGDYFRVFGTSPRQLLGNQQEMSPQHLSALGLDWSPLSGLNLTVTGNYVGERFYNQRNTAVAPSYATWDAGVSYSAGEWTWRVDGSNLSDRRDGISESELGDASYYRMPARTYWASVAYRFQ
ncbi:MAG: TonB-dependent receptor [Lysobacterales bacterium]